MHHSFPSIRRLPQTLAFQGWAALFLVFLADIFFYNRIIGWPAGVYFGLLTGLACLRNPWRSLSIVRKLALVYCLLASISLFLMPHTLGVLLCLFCLLSVSCLNDLELGRAKRWAETMLLAIPHAVGRPFLDMGLARRFNQRAKEQKAKEEAFTRLAKAWLPPLGLLTLFLLLFTSANPVLEGWIRYLDIPRLMIDFLNPFRLGFWFFLAIFAWMILRRRYLRFRDPFPQLADPSDRPGDAFGLGLLKRSLPALNLLFLMQNSMDAAFLTNGLALPESLTYADYAHRGAYPLVATAILAAVIVLAAMRPGGPAERSDWVRRLTFFWIGQNILLCLTSMFRLSLYVDAYSLTMLRLSAFIWMGLVASGLVLIILRITLRRGNGWLINANSVALALVLLLVSFAPMKEMTAAFNLNHCREMGGPGIELDAIYLERLGPEVLPALHRVLEKEDLPVTMRNKLTPLQHSLARDLCQDLEDWRGWTPGRARQVHGLDCGRLSAEAPLP